MRGGNAAHLLLVAEVHTSHACPTASQGLHRSCPSPAPKPTRAFSKAPTQHALHSSAPGAPWVVARVGSITETWRSSSSSCQSHPPSAGHCCPSSAASHKGTGWSCGVRMRQATAPPSQPGAPRGVCKGLAQYTSQWARVTATPKG